MKSLRKIAIIGTALAMAVSLVGCGDGMSAREKACLDHGGTWDTCTNEGRYQERQLAKIENGYVGRSEFVDYGQRSYPPVEMGQSYTNYYGNPNYGYWEGGRYRFNDPYSQYAINTNSFLLGAGLGGLASYALTPSASQATWSSSHSGGWKEEKTTAKKYYGKNGKEISKSEYTKRKAQSQKDRQAYKAKQKAKAKTQAKKTPTKNSVSSKSTKPNLSKKTSINLKKTPTKSKLNNKSNTIRKTSPSIKKSSTPIRRSMPKTKSRSTTYYKSKRR
jgi:uncharacterized lipoprotein YehR (DUF1307 family)